MIIAIDGPAGVGKSTVSAEVAKKLGFSCMDTGAMYRAVAYKAVSDNIDLYDDETLGSLAENIDIQFIYEDNNPAFKTLMVDGQDITFLIRTEAIDKAVTPVSASKPVRKALIVFQRELAKTGDFVVEGRDIGTVVFPDAKLKIYLTAEPETRAARRLSQNIERGTGSQDITEIFLDLERRDRADSTRENSPLMKAEDAFEIDTTLMPMRKVVAEICYKVIEQRR